MARRRFFVPAVRRGLAELTGADAEHLVRVLRVEPGQIYELSDNEQVYLAKIESARKALVSFQILETLPAEPPAVEITLLAALIKFDRFEWLLEKATELGVAAIQPFEATRSDHGLAQAAVKRLARWEKIAVEASQQSRRRYLPRIEPVIKFTRAIEQKFLVRFLLDETPDAPPVLQLVPGGKRAEDRVALLLGPEGGWTVEERTQAQAAGWQSCSLGRTVLRSETAALAALAVVQAAWADAAVVAG